ncbi:tyrosine-type recombinase/integrase [Bifidobacterium polysaccharolyticum]|uniref:tyrosine-type recombinase/integrase n=1 Tax=Bifidobacterium polysaccharolyticum TaxID=2750967 RepID=UPI0018DD5AB3|nr:site-specific integrase [Bifidobacterium polysaccharolyticum]MBI0064548.1 tyrosine-type recombinase/integrase [Bifidobacterium polysaccharolyticum]
MPLKTDARSGRKYIEARYQPPVSAYSRWPGLPKRITRRFPVGFETEAERWLNEAETAIRMGTWEPPQIEEDSRKAGAVTFAQYSAAYLQKHRKANGEPIAPTTRQKYEQYLRDDLLPILGDMSMAAIRPKDIQRWADSMKVGKAGEGASIKRHVWELLSAIFKEACSKPLDEEGTTLLRNNPVLLRVDKPNSNRAYGDVSMEELNALVEAMPGRFSLVLYLVGVLSLRPGEAYALQRKDIELVEDGSGGVVHITKSAKGIMKDGHKVMEVSSTKTKGSVRDLELPPFLIPHIRHHLDTYVEDRPNAWLFTGERTRGLVFDQSVRNAWYRARKAVPRLEQRKLRLYDLRHRALTEVAKHTNSIKAIMAQGGHTQVSTAMHYQHVTESERGKILAGIEADGEAAEHGGKPAQPPEGIQESGQELHALAAALESMDLEVRVQVLNGLSQERRNRVLACFSAQVQAETMTILLSKAV